MKQLNREELITLINDILKTKCLVMGRPCVRNEDVAIWITDIIFDLNGVNLTDKINISNVDMEMINGNADIKEELHTQHKEQVTTSMNQVLEFINANLEQIKALIDYNHMIVTTGIAYTNESINKEVINPTSISETNPKQLNIFDQIAEVEASNNHPINMFQTYPFNQLKEDEGISFNIDGTITGVSVKPKLKIKLVNPKPVDPTLGPAMASEDSRMIYVKALETWINFTPTYESDLAACMDCKADVKSLKDSNPDRISVDIERNQRITIPLGFSCATPKGYKLSIKPRSGLANKKGLTIVNSPGTVDEDYRGVVMVILLNTGTETITINHGDRICQAELERYEQAEIEVVDELSDTKRGSGGMGSTGVK